MLHWLFFLALVLFVVVWFSSPSNTWDWRLSPLLIAFAALTITTDLWEVRQKISYQDGVIHWSQFSKTPISINLSDITEVKRESTFWRSYYRPCAAIYGRDGKKIRVSKILFVDSDIERLLETIHKANPSLVMPEL
jgi:hypothetical protein